MPTGDPACPHCGSMTCFGAFGPSYCKESQLSESDRRRGELKVERKIRSFEVTDREVGAQCSPKSMRDMLTGYMGDDVFANKFMDCIDLIKVKNADYSQGEQKGDRIAAFRRIAKDINVTMEQVWAVFCQKHWGAVMKYIKHGSVESEPIEGRITDIINYMVLLAAIIDDRKKEVNE